MSITAKIITDSIAHGVRITTMELCYHRFIHSEFMTHRVFSKNASSSRAIPIEKMLKQVEENPAIPIHWGKNQPGMQAREECTTPINSMVFGEVSPEFYWGCAAQSASNFADDFRQAGYHKQTINRLLEPFQWIKVIVTATEWEGFFKLRMHPDAQPEMRVLAEQMQNAMDCSVPVELDHGHWHLPYVSFDERSRIAYSQKDVTNVIKCSVARCARVSYLNHDASVPDVAKDIALADMLLEAGHMSPFEHQATPMIMSNDSTCDVWEEGITHSDRYYKYWSGNFRSWVQYRQLLSAV